MSVVAATKANAFGALVSECELILMFFICRNFRVFLVVFFFYSFLALFSFSFSLSFSLSLLLPHSLSLILLLFLYLPPSLSLSLFSSFSSNGDFSVLIERNQENQRKNRKKSITQKIWNVD